MTRKIKRKCSVCGKEYNFCPICEDDAAKPSWMMIFDSKDCHDIYDAVTGYKDGIYDKEYAKGIISNCKLDISKYSDDIAKVLKELTKKETVKKAVETPDIKGDKK